MLGFDSSCFPKPPSGANISDDKVTVLYVGLQRQAEKEVYVRY